MRARRPGWRHPGRRPLLAVPLLVFLLFTGLPVAGIVVHAVTDSALLSNLGGEAVSQAVRLSLLTSAVSMLVVVAVGTPVAYTLARASFPGKGIVDLLIELPLVLPPVVAGIGMLLVFGRQGLVGEWLSGLGINLPFTTAAVVLAQLFVASPFYIRSAKLGFQGVEPDYEEISQTLGTSPWRTFWRISVPLALPSLLGGLALAWARAISEFGATLVFAGNFPGRTQTMPLAIVSAMERGLGPALDLSLVLIALSLIVLAALLALSRWGRGWAW